MRCYLRRVELSSGLRSPSSPRCGVLTRDSGRLHKPSFATRTTRGIIRVFFFFGFFDGFGPPCKAQRGIFFSFSHFRYKRPRFAEEGRRAKARLAMPRKVSGPERRSLRPSRALNASQAFVRAPPSKESAGPRRHTGLSDGADLSGSAIL
ncbi:hypothetical protein LX36DRAFT_60233 [Colletotrichum falcatum]|nr:hypothetical protein LX36DRAFT_60233 [Colletotrichum falcatum]